MQTKRKEEEHGLGEVRGEERDQNDFTPARRRKNGEGSRGRRRPTREGGRERDEPFFLN